MDKSALNVNRRDIAAAVARGAVQAIPLVGGVIAEVVNSIIPGQKLDRVIQFVELLEQRVSESQDKLALLGTRLKGAEGSDLLEEGIVQASRAVSEARRRHIANLIFNGIADDELRYDRIRKLLAILASLTDSELVLLTYHSRTNTIGSPWHKEMANRYPELLKPVSKEIGVPQTEVDRGALRESYEANLITLRLVDAGTAGRRLTPLGELLLRYASDPELGSTAVE